FFFLLLRQPPASPLFPYTTLFRSPSLASEPLSFRAAMHGFIGAHGRPAPVPEPRRHLSPYHRRSVRQSDRRHARRNGVGDPRRRSEEHTSELQSRFDLVCRLLLEK